MAIAAYERKILEVIEDRRKTLFAIRRQNHKISWNEHQTRYALVDPMLRALGWDLADPRQVQIDSHTSGDKPDYLLYTDRNSNPKMVVEAKRMTSGDIAVTFEQEGIERPDWMEWNPKTVDQLERYWKNFRPRLAVLTSGIFWAIYELQNARGKLPNKRIEYANVLSQDPSEYMDALKLLRRSNVRKLG